MARIAITGASGRVGPHVREALESKHDVFAIGRTEVEACETTIADITNATEIQDALSDAECVVHLAAESASAASWEEVVDPNINGTWNVYNAAVENEVDRIIFASSNHITHMYNMEDPSEPRGQRPTDELRSVHPDDAPRPSGPYGISKVTGEAIGTYFADRENVEVLNLRIGWVLSENRLRELQSSALAAYARSMWLSPRDCKSAFKQAIDVPLSQNPLTLNLISGNSERYLTMTPTMRALNFAPKDDSAEIV